MNVHRFEVGPFAENTYLLEQSGELLLVDPGFAVETEFRTFREFLEQNGGTLTGIILTHAHIDHVMGVHRVRASFDIPVYLSDVDRYLWDNFGDQARMFGLSQPPFGFQPEPLPREGAFVFGKFELECLHTPGHSPDHLSFYEPQSGIVICGDALFRESVGRTDLYKGNMELLKRSITEKLFTLPDDTMAYPGHGPETTIGHEKKHNPFVGEGTTLF